MDQNNSSGITDQFPQVRSGVGTRWRILTLAAVVVYVTGCGAMTGDVAHLQGQVTLNGKQIPGDATAFVVFVPAGKEADSVSVPVASGRYDSPRTPTGDVKVFFEINRPGPTKTSERTGQQYQDVVSLVPAKYATGLPLQVKGDDPNRDFQLTH